MMTAKPKRIKFSEEEKIVILEEFSLRKDILIPKTGRYRNTTDRQRAWEEITMAVNSLNPLVQRTPEEVRKKWKNMILDARKELATAKHPLLRRRPQERLFHNIFALFNKTGSELPEPLYAAGPGFRTKGPPSPSEPACKVEGFLDPGLVLRPQGAAMEPGQEREGLCQIEVSRKLDSWPEVSGKSLLPSPVDVQARFKEDALTEDASDYVSASVVTAEEDLLPGPRPSEEGLPEKDSGEVAKQSRLQTEILELQKETLQLQKEKILLEKEKLVLEIVKLRRELGT